LALFLKTTNTKTFKLGFFTVYLLSYTTIEVIDNFGSISGNGPCIVLYIFRQRSSPNEAQLKWVTDWLEVQPEQLHCLGNDHNNYNKWWIQLGVTLTQQFLAVICPLNQLFYAKDFRSYKLW